MDGFSVLYLDPSDYPSRQDDAPQCFGDLHLDRIVDSVIRGREEYDLRHHFHRPLLSVDDIAYRQEVFRDLESPACAAAARAFADEMTTMRKRLQMVDNSYRSPQKDRWCLDAVDSYGCALEGLLQAFEQGDLRSRGLCAARDYLEHYLSQPHVRDAIGEARRLLEQLTSLTFTVRVQGAKVTVTRFHDEADYGRMIATTFEKFRQGAVDSHLVDFTDRVVPNSVEEQVIACVADLFPELFSAMAAFRSRHAEFVDETVARLDAELQFYLAWQDYERGFQSSELGFCYPVLREDPGADRCEGVFDLSLAQSLKVDGSAPVCNDYRLDGDECVIVVTGPNQGGKTTFARAFGQVHYLASIGCRVPARNAELARTDRVLSHFEHQERVEDLRSRLEDDLVRTKHILDDASERSVLIMNEAFSSATLEDSRYLGEQILGRIADRGIRCLYVTFVEELSRLNDRIVSMVAGVDPSDPTRRTFLLTRRPADGKAFALSLAARYGLARPRITEEVSR